MPSPRLNWFPFALTVMLAVAPRAAMAQSGAPPTPTPAATPATSPADAPDTPPLKPEELEQLLAPIALYPDSLLTQIMMASTYPLEIVQADRWAKANPKLKDAALTAALEKQTWDASVKSLVNFPQVLTMMSEKLDLTIKLGDAFIAQQADVMNTIQKLRNKAQKEGQLKSNEQQKIIVEAAPPPDTTIVVQQAPPTQIIKIEPTQPEVIYVPSYNPTVVYGAWPYPAYPPYPYYPPGYVASNVMSFGLGVACGAAWGYAWGNSNWGGNDVDIDVNRNTNINNNIDRSKYKQEISNRQTDRQGNRDTRQGERADGTRGQGSRGDGSRGQGAAGGGQGSWKHNPDHRGGVPYRDKGASNKYGNTAQNRQAAQSRDAYRGRAQAGQSDLARGGASDFRGNSGAGNRATASDRAGTGAGQNRAGQGTAGQNRAGQGTAGQNRAGQNSAGQNRAGQSSAARGGSSSSLSGVDRGGSSAKASSQRGASSRSGSSASSGSRSSGGGSRSGGGGGSRGGGGGGRGGGGGGGRGRSDVALKDNFALVDPASTLQQVMQLQITTWNYKDEPDARHLGPMAQDFHRSFGIGTDDKTITYLDEGGVALSAIQGLNQRIDEKDAKIQTLEKEIAELKALVMELSTKVGNAGSKE